MIILILGAALGAFFTWLFFEDRIVKHYPGDVKGTRWVRTHLIYEGRCYFRETCPIHDEIFEEIPWDDQEEEEEEDDLEQLQKEIDRLHQVARGVAANGPMNYSTALLVYEITRVSQKALDG